MQALVHKLYVSKLMVLENCCKIQEQADRLTYANIIKHLFYIRSSERIDKLIFIFQNRQTVVSNIISHLTISRVDSESNTNVPQSQ